MQSQRNKVMNMSLGSVSLFYPGGRPSGLPEDIVQQLVDVKRKQIVDPLTRSLDAAKLERDVYSQLNSQLVALKQAADRLNESEVFRKQSVASSDLGAVSASVDRNATEGSYRVEVQSLARSHNHVLGVDDGDPDSGVTLGLDDPDDAGLIKADMKISFSHKGKEFNYFTDGETTLSSLAGKISNDDNGVTANVVNIGTGEDPRYVLTIKSSSTGAGENLITDDDGVPGLSITDALDQGRELFTVGAAGQEVAQSGENALFSVDGVQFERGDNQVTDVVNGLSLELHQAGSSVNINVAFELNSAVRAVSSLVNAYNQTNEFMSKSMEYKAPLARSMVARSADSLLSRLIYEPISGTLEEPYQYLHQVGLELDRDGKLIFDEEKFLEEFEINPRAVEKLFVGEHGLAGKIENSLRQGFTDKDEGTIASQMRIIGSRMDRIEQRIERQEERVEKYEIYTAKKFSQLEMAITKYKSMQEQLENWMDLDYRKKRR